MTLIGCPFFHCNYCNYCNWSDKIMAVKHQKKCMTAIVIIKLPPILLFQNQ